MLAAPKLEQTRWTVEEYLAFERESEFKHEFINGRIIPWGAGDDASVNMAGASRAHILISGNTHTELNIHARNRDCEAYTSEMRVRASPEDYTYPDVTVVCGKPQFEDDKQTILLNPTVLVEVLSPSTAKYDRSEKMELYRALPSVQEYLMIVQDKIKAWHYRRLPEGGWLLLDYDTADATLELESIGCTLNLADVYRKVEFPTASE